MTRAHSFAPTPIRRALVALVAGLCVPVVTGCFTDEGASDFSATHQKFATALTQWETIREREAELIGNISRDYEAEKPAFDARERDESELATVRTQRARLEADLSRYLAAMEQTDPYHVATREAEEKFLAVLCAEVSELHTRRNDLIDELRQTQVRPVLFDVHRAELDAVERRIGAKFTRLQELFPRSPLVAKLEDKVLYRRYRELIANVPEGRISPGDEPVYLRKLAEMKELFPKSNFTRKAEKHLVPRTAKRDLWDLRGWPAVVFFACVALLVVGIGRCVAGYLKYRQSEDDEPGSRVFRAAPWMLVAAPTPPTNRAVRPPARADAPPSTITPPPPDREPAPPANAPGNGHAKGASAALPVVTPIALAAERGPETGAEPDDAWGDDLADDGDLDFTAPGSLEAPVTEFPTPPTVPIPPSRPGPEPPHSPA